MFLSILSTITISIGAIVITLVAYQIVQFVSLFVFIPGPEVQLQSYKHVVIRDTVPEASKDHIHWALITGSSGGIGFGFAQHLLSLGFGVVILAHIEPEIRAAEAKLRLQYPNGSIKTVVMNCQTASVPDIEALVANLIGLSVTILINNVGGIPMEYPHFRPFAEYEAHGIDNHFDMNARFMTQLTRAMLPHLTKHAHPRALVLNITSAARVGMPWLSMYSATKSYVSGFSHALSRELRHFNQPVDCLLIVPGDVLSDGNSIGVAPGSPNAKDYARIVLERVDGAVAQGRLELSPYWKHALQIGALEWLPESVKTPELSKVSGLKMRMWAEVEMEKNKSR